MTVPELASFGRTLFLPNVLRLHRTFFMSVLSILMSVLHHLVFVLKSVLDFSC